jgi:hypothetical protein
MFNQISFWKGYFGKCLPNLLIGGRTLQKLSSTKSGELIIKQITLVWDQIPLCLPKNKSKGFKELHTDYKIDRKKHFKYKLPFSFNQFLTKFWHWTARNIDERIWMKIKQQIICSSCVADVNHVLVNVWSVLMNNTHFDIIEADVDFV